MLVKEEVVKYKTQENTKLSKNGQSMGSASICREIHFCERALRWRCEAFISDLRQHKLPLVFIDCF